MKRLNVIPAIFLMLLVAGCAKPPPPLPEALTQAEQLMQQGTAAYADDRYDLAAAAFKNALEVYHGIDDSHGIVEASMNLVETSIAVGNLSVARQIFGDIQQHPKQTVTPAERLRLILLEVRLLNAEGQAAKALGLLQPLWPEFDEQQKLREPSADNLAIVAATTRLKSDLQSTDRALWLTRFRWAQHDLEDAPNSLRYKALLFRLQARQIAKDDPDNSIGRLFDALDIYRDLVYRRGIAATLVQLAELKRAQSDLGAADGLYQRALRVNLRLLNRSETQKVLQALIEVNQQLGDSDDEKLYQEQLDKLLGADYSRD